MATRISGKCPGWRIDTGSAILSAAREVDTGPVKNRLARFERAHRAYVDAQRKVDAAEAEVRTAQDRLEAGDAVQDKAVGTLARALIADGQPLDNAFAPFGAPSIKTLVRLRFAEEAVAVHQLVAAVGRDDSLGKPTMAAAKAADEAATAVEQAIVVVEKMQRSLREVRRRRDVRGQEWEEAFAALKLDCRTVARDGAPQIFAALFPPSRPASKSKAAPVTPAPASNTPATPVTQTQTSDAA